MGHLKKTVLLTPGPVKISKIASTEQVWHKSVCYSDFWIIHVHIFYIMSHFIPNN